MCSCGSAGSFVWYRDLPQEASAQANEYVVGIGDTISIRVYEQDGLNTRGKIRSDGRLALPLVGDVLVAGKHPAQVARELEAKLKQFIVEPRVTVNVEESQPVTISILGEVAHAGSLTLSPPAELLQALAQAGGVSEYADKSAIYVLRRTPTFHRIRFTYDAITRNENGAAQFQLLTGDVIVLE